MIEISPNEIIPKKVGVDVKPEEITQGGTQAPVPFWKRAVSASARPALEMGGMVGGGLVGAATAPATGPVGPAIGVAGGYVMGTNASDALDAWLGVVQPKTVSQEIREMPGELATGMAYELVGPALNVAGKAAYNLGEFLGINGFFRGIKLLFPGMSDSAIAKKAAQILSDVRKGDFGKTTEETDDILKTLNVKTQPTFSQKTGSKAAASFEQSMSAKDAALREFLIQQDAQIKEEALISIRGMQSAGSSVDDIVKAVQNQKDIYANQAKIAGGAVESKILPPQETAQAAGLKINETLKSERAIAKIAKDAKYEQVPNVIIEQKPIKDALSKVKEDIKLRRGDKATVPSGIMNEIRKTLGMAKPQKNPAGFVAAMPKEEQKYVLHFEKLRAWSAEIDEQIRHIEKSREPQFALIRRLNMLKDGIVESMDDLLSKEKEFPEAVKYLKKAHEFFIESYVKPFRLGTVGEVLQKGFEASGSKIPYSEIPARFFSSGKMDAADDLIRAVGVEKSKNLISDFAYGQFYSTAHSPAGDFIPARAYGWINKNKTVLEKYGLLDKFKEMARVGRSSEQAKVIAKQYEQTLAKVILKADPQFIFKEIFKGRASGYKMKELLNLPGVQNNVPVISSLKKEFSEYLLSEMSSGKKVGEVIARHSEGMRLLYKDNPKVIKAFMAYHKLIDILARNKHVTYAGGSTTAEKLSSGKVIKELFAKAGQLGAVLKGAGWFFSSAKNLVVALWNAPRKYGEEQIELLLRDALVNPETAETLMMASHGIKTKILYQRLDSQLAALEAYASHKSMSALLDEMEE